MVGDLIDSIDALRQSDVIIGRLWLSAVTRRVGLLAFTGLIAIFGLGMTNIAGFYALLASEGPVWSATVVAAIDFALAGTLFLVTKGIKPGREIEQAFDARKVAIESIRADVSELKTAADAFVHDIRDVKESIIDLVHDPLDAAVQKLLIPAATSIINGLRTKKDPA
jgi:hypothetical protein